MPEAVIVATARSPIGRANKGSLKDFRPDDLAARMVGAALDQVPELERSDVDDLMLGCAQPAGEAGYNMARVVAVLSGLDTVSRCHGEPLLQLQPPDDPDGPPRHPGGRGGRVHLRRGRDGQPLWSRSS